MYLRLALFALKLGPHARQFEALLRALREADTPREFGDAVKHLIDLVVPHLEVTSFSSELPESVDDAALSKKLAEQGVDESALRDAAPHFESLLPLLDHWLSRKHG